MTWRVRYQAPDLDVPLERRLAAACASHDFASTIIAINVRRRKPDASEGEINAEIANWLARDDEADPRFRVRSG